MMCSRSKLTFGASGSTRLAIECGGTLSILVDHQVGIRGFRVGLGGVEAALTVFDGVGTTVVVAHNQMLVAYVTPTTADTVALLHGLRKQLPPYMVSFDVIVLETMPFN